MNKDSGAESRVVDILFYTVMDFLQEYVEYCLDYSYKGGSTVNHQQCEKKIGMI